nr:immunoglobulin heavy chain junction region [Macaca mulatta]MOW99730.1 immunoglobulin heavy chain junction region [Macaca mulatta]MOX01270.1 immunoglobulin heavy chain junction region [Macaca mulatta]MOX01325.1 immunoglobulin heavy chain junction region [Macaca mulatta]MOX03650.1 immunoglobulin heavy chain junction region [Macaca mulatta]
CARVSFTGWGDYIRYW